MMKSFDFFDNPLRFKWKINFETDIARVSLNDTLHTLNYLEVMEEGLTISKLLNNSSIFHSKVLPIYNIEENEYYISILIHNVTPDIKLVMLLKFDIK
jgi:hypothetical protein